MGVLQRFLDVTKAAANEALDKLENPVLMINHYTRKMEEQLDEAQEALHSQRAVERGTKLRCEEYARLAEHCEEKAASAVAEGREAEARAALAEKLVYADKAAEYLRWHEEAVLRTAELEERLEAAKAELANAQERRNELVARARKASAAQAAYEPFADYSRLDGGSAARGFRRMEEKIMQWEAQAEVKSASGGYAAQTPSEQAGGATRSTLIDEQLDRLRRTVKPQAETTQAPAGEQ